MSSMSKAQQWRTAAAVLNLIREMDPMIGEDNMRWRAVDALNRMRTTAAWEYPWVEVVYSVRTRSARALAKRAKQV